MEEEPILIECRIHGYDRDACVGKVSSEAFSRKLKFVVPPERRVELHPKVLRSMRDSVDTVMLEALRVVDQSAQPTSLVLIDVRQED